MSGEKLIDFIESPSVIDLAWYYHAFWYKPNNFSDMVTQGIKCNKILGKKDCYASHNGKYYISLSRIVQSSKDNSAFQNYFEWPSFIIDDIKATKCIQISEPIFLGNSIFPIRFSSNFDEYQAYKIITPDKYVGLRCSIMLWYQNGQKKHLENLREMILFLKSQRISLPIYDYTNWADLSIREINKDAYLEMCDDIIVEAEKIEKEREKQLLKDGKI